MRYWIMIALLGSVVFLVPLETFAGGGGDVLGEETLGALYPSPHGKDRLPDGMLISTGRGKDVYYILRGKKSIIHRSLFDRWAQEMHYFDADVVIPLSAAELARYPDGPPHNPFYRGKILRSGNTHYYIDDRYRKRAITPALAAALKYPSRNVYTVPAALLAQFPSGPAITRTDRHPGGTVVYVGPYHGGKLYLIVNDDTKREFLHDYIYETTGFAWSSQILPMSTAEIATYKRGADLSTYPDGWIVSAQGKKYLTEGGKLRWIASDGIFRALGYNAKYVLTVYQQFLKNHGAGQPITAFKGTRVNVSADNNPAAAVSTTGKLSGALSSLPVGEQQLIGQVNTIFLQVFDRHPTPEENRKWIAYIHDHQLESEAALAAAMRGSTY